MKEVLSAIVKDDRIHARWLNTLSFLENAGARKISACEDDVSVNIVQLKHAAEEHRHAYYLKKQLLRLAPDACPCYQLTDLLAPLFTRQYLSRLDVACSRYLRKHFNLSGKELRYAAYLFVTYAIELRADALYPLYQQVLSEHQSRIMVKSIILEEEGHLEEMTAMLAAFDPEWQRHATAVSILEQDLFTRWFRALSKEIISNGVIDTELA